VTAGGSPGTRLAATPVSVTVTNFPGNCPDTLDGAIVIEPYDQTCVEAPDIDVAFSTSFPNTPADTCSPANALIISNVSGATLNIASLTLAMSTLSHGLSC